MLGKKLAGWIKKAARNIVFQERMVTKMAIKTKKKKAARKQAEKGNGKARGIRGLNGKTICESWLFCFGNKAIKTSADCTVAMKKNFPGRESAVFNYPNAIKGRAARGLLDHGKKHVYAKYAG